VVCDTCSPVVRSIRAASSALVYGPRPAGRVRSMSQFILSAKVPRADLAAVPSVASSDIAASRRSPAGRLASGCGTSPQNPHKSASAADGPHKNPTYKTALSGTHRHGC
jgi:hypothetical protein